jgi:carbonic anhydrase
LPEKLLGLNIGECFIFRTVAGHPQPALEDLASLDIEIADGGVKDVMIIYHTG